MALEQLSQCQIQSHHSTDAAVDIVAIHGIYEDAVETWTDPKTGVLWLRDLLPEKLHNVRVLTYNYKAEALTSPGQGTADRILPHATSLVAELCADRQLNDAYDRPIIFICHGLGGLLAKRALAYSSSRRHRAVEHLRSIYTSTYGILFLGTPHNGISKETLFLPRTGDSPGPSQFMISLLQGSEMLNEITDQFAPLMKRFSIYNFWEEMETQAGIHKVYIVDKDSAAPAWDNVERCGITATHSGITKFHSQSDHGYRTVLEALSRYVKRAPALIRSRWQNEMESMTLERQREAEELFQPRLQYMVPDEAIPKDFNQWCILPRSPSSYFTGRQTHAKDVKEMLGPIRMHDDRNKHKVLVLYGLGGSGKTQFCLKYVEDNKHRYWGIFWIDASNEGNIQSGFASIGERAGRGATLVAGMYWLSRCTQPWLLVLDNADDPDMDISKYCPIGGNGHILVTTRNPSAIEHATAGHIRFRGMEPDEATSLLLKSAFPDPQHISQPASPRKRQLAEGIAMELGYLALALAHAGATIRRNIYTLEKYLHYYLGHRRTMMSYSQLKGADEANIITTWEIPFRKIASRGSVQHKDAVDLMHIFAFMHFESIPESIFQRSWSDIRKLSFHQMKHPEILQSVWNEEAQARLRRAIRVLYDHSIIDHEPSKASCSMHPVIHTWARDRLTDVEQKQWLCCTMGIIALCISPHLEPSGRKFRGLLLPHIKSCRQALKSLYPPLPYSLERAAELERFAWVYAEQGQWGEARKLQYKVIEVRMKLLGKGHEDTLRAQRSLGQTYWNLFDVKPAIEIQLKVLKSRWWCRPYLSNWLTWPPWRPIHVPYCLALDDLTLTLWLAGQREWSKKAGERAVEGLRSRLGPDDPKTLLAMFNLARTYLHLGEQKKSHSLLVQVLKTQKRFFGLNHPDTLMTRNELGISFCASKRHMPVAERLVTNVLQARREILGEEHAYTLWSVNDLSKIYCERGRPEQAVAILEDIVPVVSRTLGDEHVGMSLTRSNLGRAYFMAERWKEAEETVRPLLAMIPSDHPDWIHNMYGYAHIQLKLGLTVESEKNCIKLLDKITQTKCLALDHPRTVAIADLLLRIYRLQGRENDVAAMKKKVPAADEIDSENRFDPYSIRRASDDARAKVFDGVPSGKTSASDSDSRHAQTHSLSKFDRPIPSQKLTLVARRTL
ncbi:TPR-like protein [Zopfia rhizophila CBS 207.26]|uniref:TPR-like protein n=1 Tax=Zopfia rhizophila CBS 207.26 TaxID=1314779 RepID=A0A6A6E7P8_9PEZI|nr:TPR-like protein [Zopfia rhizophila CBS 207.26]